ncbi:MAG: hypothetical protein ACUVXD_19390 [Thermodesulfobacteriota bacterium]
MGKWRERIERWSSAVAFAEAGDSETAVRMVGLSPSGKRVPVDDVFTAVTFAEAGLPEMAMEFLGESFSRRARESEGFLSAVGLKGVRVWYGLVEASESFDFAASMGLKGVRLWYGTARVAQ